MIEILADETEFMVAVKPVGLDFHDNQGEPGFFSQLQQQVGQRIYALHRLDKVTSGLLLVAKTLEACQRLNRMFEEHQIGKYYVALSDRKAKKKQGWVVGDMERSRRSSWRLLTTKEKPAVTQFFSYGLGNGYRLFLLRPLTGRTHQLRVAMKSLGAAISGDDLYYPGKTEEDRCYLHAYALTFEYDGAVHSYTHLPDCGEYFQDRAFIAKMETLTDPWTLSWPKSKKKNAGDQ